MAQTGLIHVRSAVHTVSYARLSEDKYHNVCNELGIRTDYPISQELDGIEALSGFDIYTMALICGVDECSMIFASRGAMRKHYDIMHKGVPIPTIWHIVSAQRLDNGSHKTYFWVTESPYVFRPILNKDWIHILDTRIDDAMKIIPLFNSDPHYLNALLTKQNGLTISKDLIQINCVCWWDYLEQTNFLSSKRLWNGLLRLR